LKNTVLFIIMDSLEEWSPSEGFIDPKHLTIPSKTSKKRKRSKTSETQSKIPSEAIEDKAIEQFTKTVRLYRDVPASKKEIKFAKQLIRDMLHDCKEIESTECEVQALNLARSIGLLSGVKDFFGNRASSLILAYTQNVL
jgi:hypothetical protein